MKKFVSWNVNGFRACLQKGFDEVFQEAAADFFCLQETKMQPGQADFAPAGYHAFFHSAEKKGYSGTAIFAKEAPLSVQCGVNGAHLDEGRVIALEYPGFYLLTCYSPNAQEGLKRLDYRMAFEDDLRAYLGGLAAEKPVILCGDLNVAHQEIDLKNPGPNRGSAGFSDEERAKFTELLTSGFVDTFRHLYPRLFLVELSLQCPQEQRGLAHRLFPRLRSVNTRHPGGRHSRRYPGQRPLPRVANLGCGIESTRANMGREALSGPYFMPDGPSRLLPHMHTIHHRNRHAPWARPDPRRNQYDLQHDPLWLRICFRPCRHVYRHAAFPDGLRRCGCDGTGGRSAHAALRRLRCDAAQACPNPVSHPAVSKRILPL